MASRRELAIVLTVGVTSAVTACRSVLGIDEDVPLIGAGDGGVQDDGAASGGSGDASGGLPDAASDGGTVPVDRRFANYRLPPPSPPLDDYDRAKSSVVTDLTTGLVWQREDSVPATMGYVAAAAYCESLELDGATDWRLPTRMELFTLLDYGQANGMVSPAVVTLSGPVFQLPQRWTDSVNLVSSSRLLVDQYSGAVDRTSSPEMAHGVRCVRGGPTRSPAARYSVHSDGTALDVATTLHWKLAASPATRSIEEAEGDCASLGAGWRLPTARELVSLIDESRSATPFLNPIFSPGPKPRFWSSTRRVNPNTTNYAVDFDSMSVGNEDRAVAKLAVRCVHD